MLCCTDNLRIRIEISGYGFSDRLYIEHARSKSIRFYPDNPADIRAIRWISVLVARYTGYSSDIGAICGISAIPRYISGNVFQTFYPYAAADTGKCIYPSATGFGFISVQSSEYKSIVFSDARVYSAILLLWWIQNFIRVTQV